MRERILKIELVMNVGSIASITEVDGPKDRIDAFMTGQLGGSFVRYSYQEYYLDCPKALIADMHIVVTDRSQAATKMNAIENNLNLLPSVVRLDYTYRERENFPIT